MFLLTAYGVNTLTAGGRSTVCVCVTWFYSHHRCLSVVKTGPLNTQKHTQSSNQLLNVWSNQVANIYSSILLLGTCSTLICHVCDSYSSQCIWMLLTSDVWDVSGSLSIKTADFNKRITSCCCDCVFCFCNEYLFFYVVKPKHLLTCRCAVNSLYAAPHV